MSESERAGARARAREREWERERELRVLLYKHLYCLVLSLSRALSLSVIDHLCVLLQTAWGVRPSCRAAHDARVRLPRRRGFPAASVRVDCRSLHQGAAPRSDFTASCARSHARTLARTHARTHARSHCLACIHACMSARMHTIHARYPHTFQPSARTHHERCCARSTVMARTGSCGGCSR